MMKVVMAYSGAVLAAFVTASVLATQIILGNVAAMGMDVTLGVRLHATLHDIVGLSLTYLPLIAIAFLLALLVVGGLVRLLPGQRALLFALAGGAALVSLHVIMKAVLGISGIAATRSLAGLLSQGLAGAAGGYAFYAIRKVTTVRPAT
jgi:hypothetical protein